MMKYRGADIPDMPDCMVVVLLQYMKLSYNCVRCGLLQCMNRMRRAGLG